MWFLQQIAPIPNGLVCFYETSAKGTHFEGSYITVHRQAFSLLDVESGTRKFTCLSVECLSVESGTYYVICQFCMVKGMVVESEVLKDTHDYNAASTFSVET